MNISLLCSRCGLQPWIVKQRATSHGIPVRYEEKLVSSARLSGRIIGILNNASIRAGHPLGYTLENVGEAADIRKAFAAAGPALSAEEKNVIAALIDEADVMYEILRRPAWGEDEISETDEFRTGFYIDLNPRPGEGIMDVKSLLTFSDREFLFKAIQRGVPSSSFDFYSLKNDYTVKAGAERGPVCLDDDRSLQEFRQDDRYGLRRANGEVVLKPEFANIYDYKERGWMVEKDGHCGLVNNYGEFLFSVEYDDIRPAGFANGGHMVDKDDLWGYFDTDGRKVLDFMYDDLDDYDEDRMWCAGFVAEKNGKSGYITPDGKTIIPFRYDAIYYMKDDGRILVERDGKRYYIDRNLNETEVENEE